MKIFLIICAIFAVVLSDPCETEHLQISSCKTNLHEFMRMIPMYDLIQLYQNYVNNNELNIMNAFAYFKSQEFKDALEIVTNLESLIPFHKDAAKYNVTIEELLYELSGRLGYETWQKNRLNDVVRGGKSFHDFLEDAKVFVRKNDISDLSINAFYSDGLYKKWYCQYNKMDKNKFVKEAMEQDIVKSMLEELVKLNVDVVETLQFVKSCFVNIDDFECYDK